jgi:hypothetical protein
MIISISKQTIPLFFLGLLIIFGLFLVSPSATAIERERYISNIAEKDTYVDTANPTSNYGGVSNLMTGFSIFSDIREAYFYFNFSNKPSNYERAEISLEFWGVSQTMNYTICLIEESWSEFSMTWINKPNKGQVISNIIVTSDTIYSIDVSSMISGRNNLSICVYIEIDNYVDDYAYITSKEGYYFNEDAPQLKWIYTETAEISISNPTSSSEWQEGSTYIITWTSLGSISRVKIELFKASNLIEELTFMYTDNDGSFDFYVSSLSDYQEGSDYRIKITDYDDSNVYDYSEYFTISENGGFSDIDIPSYNLLILLGIAGIALASLIIKARKNSNSFK